MRMTNQAPKIVLVLLLLCWWRPLFSDKLTEEQMTAYRVRPPVVLIYSGMFVEVKLKDGQKFQIPNYGSGSGFFINPEGYLVTNGHVVDSYSKYVADKAGYADKVFKDFVVQKIVAEYKQNQGREPTQQEIEQEVQKFIQNFQPEIANHGAINYVLLSNSETMQFEMKKFSPSIPEGGKDIAILKVERENCPVIMLGDSSQLVLQQKIFVVGFPGVVDPQRFPLLDKANTLKSSITAGAVSALKTDFKGMAVIQHDAATSPGNSGGPMVDLQGRVQGVHSYAAQQYDGFKFCVPINSAKEFIRDAGVEFNIESDFTKVFNQLMDAVWNEEWFEAQNLAASALTYMDREPDLKKLQQMILTRIRNMSFIERIWKQNKLIVIIGVGLVLVIILVLIIAFKPASTATPPAAPPQQREPARPASQPQPIKPEPLKTALEGYRTESIAEAGHTVVEEDIIGTITVLEKDENIGTFNIYSGGVTIGRDPKSVEVFISSNIVSKAHCKITPKGDDFLVEDLGSTNGTYVNSEKIKAKVVKTDDLLQLGRKGEVRLILKK